MSANMFAKQKNPENSRIPVPASPTPLRRHNSLRIRGEKKDTTPPYNKLSSFSRETNHLKDSNKCVGLKRGSSFMERGERRDNYGIRPHNIKIDMKSTKGPTTPQSPARIRSLSLSLSNTRLNSTQKSPTVNNHHLSPINNQITSPDIRNYSLSTLDWDSESITSISSVASCDHATIARNGTTFSGRSMKYVFHCNQHAGVSNEEYLTPTQRAHRQVKKLKYLLHQAKKDLEQKDSDILKLTKEVVELRLYKAALNSPEDKSNSSSGADDAVTVKENHSDESTPSDTIDNNLMKNDIMTGSFADSGHFEDEGTSIHFESPDKLRTEETTTTEKCVSVNLTVEDGNDVERNKLIMEYERRLQELVRTHEEESYQLKQKHNDKIEELLQRITDINKRYWELVPELETAKERIKELEVQLEDASRKLEEQEERQKDTLLKMYDQGKEAARLESENVAVELAHQNPGRVSVPELLQELQVTKNELERVKDVEYASSSNSLQPLLSAKEALSLWVLGARKAMYRQLMEAKNKNKIDPEITLQFLKSAVYYFLTDKENSQGHLKAIESILGFTSSEISNIDKARYT